MTPNYLDIDLLNPLEVNGVVRKLYKYRVA